MRLIGLRIFWLLNMTKQITLAVALIALLFSCNHAVAANKTHKYYSNVTWYQCCKKTANGEQFDPNGFTAAHRSLPFDTIVRLTNPKTGQSIVVRINDRGPFSKGKEFDVSRGGAIALGFFHSGTAKLLVEVLRKAK